MTMYLVVQHVECLAVVGLCFEFAKSRTTGLMILWLLLIVLLIVL